MKQILSFCFLLLFVAGYLLSQPIVQFDKTYGGPGCEDGRSAKQTPDGGYVMIGRTDSYGAGLNDIYLVKTDENGDVLWTKTYGGIGEEKIGWSMKHNIILTKDGGFVIVGYTNSYGNGNYDIFLIKTDMNGDTLWTKTYGSPSADYGFVVQQTSDEGYVITGQTWGFGSYENDVYLVKTDADGNLEWQNTYPLYHYETGNSLQQTADGGYLITGVTYSPETAFLLKIDAGGNFEWKNNIIGGIGYSIEKTTDGGFIICGTTGSNSFLSKTDDVGNILWTKTIEGPGANYAYSIQQLDDGGYIVAGETNGYGNNWNFYVFRTDQLGDTLWTKVFEDAGNDWATSIDVCSDGSYLVAGYTNSYGAGCSDYRMMKLKEIISSCYITGIIYKDDNDNCIFEPDTDAALNGQMVVVEPGPYYGFTDSNGKYILEVEPDNYTIKQTSTNKGLYSLQDCQPDSVYFVTVSSGTTVSDLDFVLSVKKPLCEGTVHIVSSPFEQGPCTPPLSLSSPCPGYLHRYCFTITNSGTSTITPGSYVQVDLDPNMTFAEEVSNSCTGSLVGDFSDPTTPLWNITNASALNSTGDFCEVCFNVNVLDDPFPNPYSTTSNLIIECGQQTDSDSETELDFDACSCDPNDKLVSPKGCGPYGNISMNENITYRIRFQNIGTGPAHNITIIDTLNSNFDLNTFSLLISSHNITRLQISPGNILEVTYEGIELPDSASNPTGSQGELFFEITPLPNQQEGTVISNNAAIYFDNNPPVITNTVINTLLEIPVPVADFTYQRDCESIDNVYSFTYTGGTSDNATFYWNFGDANPVFSIDENPVNIVFNNTGINKVTLTVERYGCTDSYFLTIDVPVVTCGNGKKIIVCHIPSGNPENPQTICISPNALSAHLAQGDCVGPCFTSVNKSSISKDNENITSFVSQDSFVAYPNPFKNSTTINFTSSIEQTILLEVYNITGQKIATLFNNKANAYQHYKVEFKTENYPTGLYFAVLKCGKQNKVIKLSIVK